MNRRSVIAFLGGIGALALSKPAAGARHPAKSLSEEDFRRYIAKFNANDYDGFSAYYDDRVVFEGQAGSFASKADVVRFYREVKTQIEEKVSVRSLVVGATGLVAELQTELHALVDVPGLRTGAMAKGERRASINFVWYDIAGGKFTRIRSARYQRLPSPTAEAQVERVATAGAPAGHLPQITPESFRRYIDAFNRADEAVYGQYYDPNVVLVLGGSQVLTGRNDIFAFYRVVREGTRRVIQIKNVLVDGNSMAVELESEFEALQDHPMYLEQLRKGDRRWQNTVVLYDLEQGRFARVRSASFKTKLTPAPERR